MEPDDVNPYKRTCAKHFAGKRVFFDAQISPEVRWRPHLYVTNGEELIVDIRTTSWVPQYQLDIYREIRNQMPDVKIYDVIVEKSKYSFAFLEQCNRYGIGVFVLDGTRLRELVKPALPTIEKMRERSQFAIQPDAPYGNIVSLKQIFRKCTEFVHWYENNLPKKVLEILYRAFEDDDIDNVEEIKLLRVLDDGVDEGLLSDFKRFRAELAGKHEVNAEMRIVCDKSVKRSIHDRYLYTQGIAFVLPPLNSLLANQWGKIFTSKDGIPSFSDYWKRGLDLVAQWNTIQKEKDGHPQ
jgi:hypothetical protein